MTDESTETRELLRRARRGDQQALGDLFRLHRSRLRHMVQLLIGPVTMLGRWCTHSLPRLLRGRC